MTEHERFEARFEARLRAYAARGGRPFDAADIARAAIRQSNDLPLATLWGWRAVRSAVPVTALLLLMIALVAAGILVGARLLEQSLPGPPSTSGIFEASGNLTAARSGHTAIRLQDGRVLVVGGWHGDGEKAPPPTELWDPRTGAFTTIEPIVPAFHRHRGDSMQAAGFSATLLGDGRVLIAGGRHADVEGPPPTDRAVLFDPSSGQVSATGPMTAARAGHAAALLPDGRVLVAGGIGLEPGGGQRSLASAEVYDPVTGMFTRTGPMVADRACCLGRGLAATVLPDGRVLVSGGGQFISSTQGVCCDGGPVDGADEIYDPGTGRFTSVLLYAPPPGGTQPIFILPNQPEQVGGIYRYDLEAGTAENITPQPAEAERAFGPRCRDLPADCRLGMSITQLGDGRILVAGGRSTVVEPPGAQHTWRPVAAAGEVFDPATGVVTPTGPLVQARDGHSATLLADGRVLLVGGQVPNLTVFGRPGFTQAVDLLRSAEVFTPG